MFYRVERDRMHDLGLWGREAMVYSALLYLCKNAPWKGSMQELADFSVCGSDDTALRMRDNLLQKGYIILTNDGISLPQNAVNVPQNAVNIPQNAENSKRKSNQKENNNKLTNIHVKDTCVREEEFLFPNFDDTMTVDNAQCTMHGDKLFSKKIPGNTGFYKVIIGEKGYLNPKKYVNEMYEYYNAHGWAQGDKLGMMRLWMTNEPKMKGGDKPTLSEDERAYLRTFLDALPQYAVVHFCDVMRGFKMTDKKAVFYFSADKMQAVAQWLMDIKIADKMVAYGRELTVARE